MKTIFTDEQVADLEDENVIVLENNESEAVMRMPWGGDAYVSIKNDCLVLDNISQGEYIFDSFLKCWSTYQKTNTVVTPIN